MATKLEPETAEALLDREEALAIERISAAVRDVGEDLSAAVDLRQRVRRHPLLATVLAAGLGYVGGPLAFRALGRVLRAPTGILKSSTPRTGTLPGLALASLRAVRLWKS